MTDADLLKKAVAARKRAYAPYSNYPVGAALLAANGEVFSGCNVENASYGLTNCAERSAVCAAVAAGQREFRKIALSLTGGGTPCGACRQVLNEFSPNLLILIGNESGELVDSVVLSDLLPAAFGPANLKTDSE